MQCGGLSAHAVRPATARFSRRWHMVMTRRERTGFELPELWRRFFETDPEAGGGLRVEEMRDGDDWVVRFELPGIDPERDVELTVLDGILHIRARREDRAELDDDTGY